ncbi:hypothetical protein [Acinetobacter sp. YH01022]|uniref:hypothetical protein n=1 Tax=Acinetobacter sp. YH01022 TaxID=2601036 RepID=UPI0015D316ED|nr:hypothetical protein [Acinetobacter sp. YH01022]
MQKNKTIWVLLRSHVVALPPIMTVLQCLLELNQFKVGFISTQASGLIHEDLEEYIVDQKHNVNKINRIINYLEYRALVNKTLDKHLKSEDLVWVGSLDTALACKGLGFFAKNPYVLHLHELYDTHQDKLKSIKNIAQNAKHVVVPELNRAGILQVWLALKNRPIVLPNKPYRHPRKKNLEPTHELTRNILQEYKTDKPIILYQGHIGGDRNLMPIAEAMRELPEYEFWLLGPDHGYAEKLVATSPNVKYVGSVPAPYHLEITSYASIGIMSYDLINLNNLYCAPNKVWEYIGFGIPFLSNDCLSLREFDSFSLICDFEKNNIVNFIKKFLVKMDILSSHCNSYYDDLNIKNIILDLVG